MHFLIWLPTNPAIGLLAVCSLMLSFFNSHIGAVFFSNVPFYWINIRIIESVYSISNGFVLKSKSRSIQSIVWVKNLRWFFLVVEWTQERDNWWCLNLCWNDIYMLCLYISHIITYHLGIIIKCVEKFKHVEDIRGVQWHNEKKKP